MATLREWLNRAEFDWENGKILYHAVGEDEDAPGWSEAVSAEYLDHTHPILDQEFHDGYGGPRCPRIVAKDNVAIYFPGMYDGSTWLAGVWLDLDKYLDYEKCPTPYIGGN
jgi:hypothetical protein